MSAVSAVLDTNVVLSSQLSTHPGSPNLEILTRWEASQFDWLINEDLLQEYAEKLIEHGIDQHKIIRMLSKLRLGGRWISITFFHLRHYPVDPDDTPFLLAALNGNATHLVTYDLHLEDVGVFYPEFITCKPLVFLQDLRLAVQP